MPPHRSPFTSLLGLTNVTWILVAELYENGIFEVENGEQYGVEG